jgi:hypothetical protein
MAPVTGMTKKKLPPQKKIVHALAESLIREKSNMEQRSAVKF